MADDSRYFIFGIKTPEGYEKRFAMRAGTLPETRLYSLDGSSEILHIAEGDKDKIETLIKAGEGVKRLCGELEEDYKKEASQKRKL